MISAGLAILSGLVPSLAIQPEERAIRIVVFSTVHVVQRNLDGSVTTRRGFISEADEERIKLIGESIQSETTKVTVSFDPEPIVVDANQPYNWETSTLGNRLLQTDVLPMVNTDPFEIDAGTPLGPYDQLIVVHAGRTDLGGSVFRQLKVNEMAVSFKSWNMIAKGDSVEDSMQRLFSSKPLPPTPWKGEKTGETWKIDAGSNLAFSGLEIGGPIDPTKTPFLTVRLKANETAPVGLHLYGEDGSLGYFPLMESLAGVTEKGLDPSRAPMFQANGSFQTITLDISSISKPVTGIAVGADPRAPYLETNKRHGYTFEVTTPVASSTGSVTPFQPESKMPTLGRMTGALSDAQFAKLTGIGESGSLAQRIEAAMILQSAKHTDAAELLTKLIMSSSPMETDAAAKALAHQNTPDSWAALMQAGLTASFNHGRVAALKLVAKLKPELVKPAQVNTLMARPSWRLRRAGAQAIAASNSAQKAIFLLAVVDPDPRVRLAVSEAAPMSEYSERRLIWTAVNDPSQMVRAATYKRLIDANTGQVRTEALAGVKDESVTVRLQILEQMIQRAQPHYRPALQRAVIDRDPRVRAACLRAFAVQPDKTQAGEIQNTFTDNSAVVLLALTALAVAGKVDLPAAVVESLKNSAFEDVRTAAAKLKSGTN